MKKKILALILTLLNTFIFTVPISSTAMENTNDNYNYSSENSSEDPTQEAPDLLSDELFENISPILSFPEDELNNDLYDDNINSNNKNFEKSNTDPIYDFPNIINEPSTESITNNGEQNEKSKENMSENIKKVDIDSEKNAPSIKDAIDLIDKHPTELSYFLSGIRSNFHNIFSTLKNIVKGLFSSFSNDNPDFCNN